MLEFAAPLLGAGLGLLSGGDQESTTVTRPYLPKEREDAYKKQLEDALKLYETPFDPRPTQRVAYSYPTNSFDSLFQNPQLAELQRRSDQSYFESLLSPVDQPQATGEDEAAKMKEMESRLIGRDYLNSAGGSMAQPRSTNTAQFRAKQYLDSGLLSDSDLAAIGNYASETQKAGGHMPNDRDMLDAYLAAINVNPLIEAYKRKGMM